MSKKSIMEKYSDRCWKDAFEREFGTPEQQKELKSLKAKLSRKRLLKKNLFWGWQMDATNRIRFFKGVLAGVNHTIRFEKYRPLPVEG